MHCGKTADCIRIPFGVVSEVGRGTGVLDGVVSVEEEGTVLGVNLGRPIVTSGAFETRSSQITLRTCFRFMSMFRRCDVRRALRFRYQFP